jgi:hypothetical protein
LIFKYSEKIQHIYTKIFVTKQEQFHQREKLTHTYIQTSSLIVSFVLVTSHSKADNSSSAHH